MRFAKKCIFELMRINRVWISLSLLLFATHTAYGTTEAWVSNIQEPGGDGFVNVIDTTSHIILATIAFSGPITDLVIANSAEQGPTAYVLGVGFVRAVDVSTRTPTATIVAGTSGNTLALSPNGEHLYVCNSNSISVVDTATNTIIATISPSNNPRGLGASATRLYSGTRASGILARSVLVMDIDNNYAVVATLPFPQAGAAILPRLTPNEEFVYANTSVSDELGIAVIQTSDNTITNTLVFSGYPDDSFAETVFIPNEARAYALTANETIFVLDTDPPSWSSTIVLPNLTDSIHGAAVTANGAQLWVAVANEDDPTDNRVVIINTSNNMIAQNILLSSSNEGPFSIAFTPPEEIAWDTSSSGSWNDNTNWNPELVPNGAVEAQFPSFLAGPIAVTIDSSVTINSLLFEANNSYTIQGEQLHLDSSSTSLITIDSGTAAHEISAPIQLHKPLTIDQSTTADFTLSGVISESGSRSVTINTAGNVILSGNSSYTGNTTVQAGTLTVNGSIANSPTTTVNVGATLAGTGTVGELDLSGNLSPGTVTTPLTVQGNVTFNATSNTTVTINDQQEASSLLIPEGMPYIATIADGAILTVEPVEVGLYQAGMEWVILTAPEVVHTNGFTLEVEDERFATLLILYVDSLSENSPGGSITLFLPASVLIGIPTENTSGNSLILANYLNTLVDVPSLQSTLGDLAALSGNALQQALTSVDPLRIASSTFTLLNTQFTFNQFLFSRLVQQRILRYFPAYAEASFDVSWLTASLALPKEKKRESKTTFAWAQGFGLFAHEEGKDTNPSFDTMSGGFLVAVDKVRWDSLLAGIGFGYAHNALTQDHNLGKSTSEMALATLYAGYYDAFFIDVAAWAGYNWVRSTRHVEFPEFNHNAKAKFNSWQIGPHLDFGYSFICSWGGIEPFASFDCPFVFTEAFKERGAAPLDMDVASNTAWMLRSEGGISFYEWWPWETGTLAARQTLSYVNKRPFSVGRVTAAVVGQPGSFTVETFQDTEHLFSPTFEIFFKNKKGIFSSLIYKGEFGSGYIANEVLGKVGIYF